jgi:nucleoside-diphosphate-sugar epimerase
MLGGTRFVGRAIARTLAADHELMLVHRGRHEPDSDPVGTHLHVDRAELEDVAAAVASFDPEAVVDVSGMSRVDAERALAVVPTSARKVAISSMDVYRAYAALHRGSPVEPVPLDETAPRRTREHWYLDRPEWENVELEDVYLDAGATVLRLGAVYGEHDPQRRLDFVLDRVRAGRARIPIGSGTFLFSRVYVDDVARAVALALTADVAGEVFNVCERRTWTYRRFAELILVASGSGAELVTVPDALLPSDLLITGSLRQHVLGDSGRARARLGWEETDPLVALARTVAWSLEHAPADRAFDAGPDDRALAAATTEPPRRLGDPTSEGTS